MSWYQEQHDADERTHIFRGSEQTHYTSSSDPYAADPCVYIPLRTAPDILIGASNHSTSRLSATPLSTGGLGTKSQKRRMDEAAYAAGDKRARSDGLPTAATRPGRRVIHEDRSRSTKIPLGTQHDPVQIESSPEPDCHVHLPGREAYIAKRQQQEANASRQFLLDACIHVSDPKQVKGKPKYYAVPGGHNPGIYTDWGDVEQQIRGFPGAKHKKFNTEAEAWDYMTEHVDYVQTAITRRSVSTTGPYSRSSRVKSPPPAFSEAVHLGLLYGSDRTGPGDGERAITQPVAPEPEPVLSDEQQQVVDLILAGHNVFYTGSAGCGKSTILKAFVKQLHARGKRVRIVAPTNLAALNVNGQTTWNFAGWTPDSMKKPLDKLMNAAHGKEVYERFDTTDVLVLDEISMVENLMFERLNYIMKASRGEKYGGGAFGGVQLIVTGDFCQLAPVKPFQHCIGCGWELVPDNKQRPKEYRCENRHCREDRWPATDKWAFLSKAWEECNFKQVNLTEIHRQHDKKFISILQRIRTEGDILPNHAKILLNHTSETEDAIKLFSLRVDVDRINNENISKLPTIARSYKCLDHFKWQEHHKDDKSLEKNTREASDDSDTLQVLKDHRYEIRVHLKEGQRIVLQANLDPQGGLVNGSQGSIVGFEPFDPSKLPRKLDRVTNEKIAPGIRELRGEHGKYQEQQIKAFAEQNGKQPWPIVKFDNGTTKTIYADCTVNELGNEEPYSLLSRAQIPLMAGYAITVHKSQGMTLDRVIVDLSKAFEPSQIYVALSRARSLQGLKVVGLPRRNLGGANPQVKEFMNNISKKQVVAVNASF